MKDQFDMKVSYKHYTGYQDETSGKVKFYDIVYGSITDAISLEQNLQRDYEEMQNENTRKIPKPFVI